MERDAMLGKLVNVYDPSREIKGFVDKRPNK